MSIASEITRIQSAKTALKTSINAKTDSQHQITNETIDNYSSFVDSITGGSGGVYEVNSEQEMEELTNVSEGDYCVVIKGNQKLPSQYTELEYIEGTGTQYINTQYSPYKTKTEVKFKLNTWSNANQLVLASWTANNNRYYPVAYMTDGKIDTVSKNENYTVLGNRDTNEHVVIYNDENNKVYFDDVQKATVSDLDTSETNSIFLFAMHNSSHTGQDFFKGRIYYVKMTDKETGNLVRDMVPAKRKSDNVIGMYDVINNVFYTNSGSGSFTGGNEVVYIPLYLMYKYTNLEWTKVGEELLYPSTTVTPTTSQQTVPIPTGYMGLKEVIVNGVEHTGAYKVSSVQEMNAITGMQQDDVCVVVTDGSIILPTGYTAVEYIKSLNKAYIETNLALGNNFKISLNAQADQTITTYEQPIVSTWTSSNNYWNIVVNTGNVSNKGFLNFYVGQSNFPSSSRMPYETVSPVEFVRNGDNFTMKENQNVLNITKTGLPTNNTTVKIFRRGDLNNDQSNVKLYNLSIEKDGVLVRNMIPCYRNLDNVIGMYDTVNNIFYTNAGNGSFTMGSVVGTTYDVYVYDATNGWVAV